MPEKKHTYSEKGLALTKEFEGLRLTAYLDFVGLWTIGYGHTGHDVHEGMTITQEQADALLTQDVAWAAETVNRLVQVPLTQHEFDAVVDFVFNVGRKAFGNSTMLRKLNAGNYAGAADEFPKWCKAGGKVVAGLVSRRQAEQDLFRYEVEEFDHVGSSG